MYALKKLRLFVEHIEFECIRVSCMRHNLRRTVLLCSVTAAVAAAYTRSIHHRHGMNQPNLRFGYT